VNEVVSKTDLEADQMNIELPQREKRRNTLNMLKAQTTGNFIADYRAPTPDDHGTSNMP
jgi:hypothetical protein